MITACEAAEHGLVNRVVPGEEVRGKALSMARRIAAKSPVTVAIGKAAFYRQLEVGLAEAYDCAATVMVENMMQADAQEGIEAFLARRKPEWKGC